MSKRRRLDTFTGETHIELAARMRRESKELREAATAALSSSGGWEEFLAARLRHQYSWRNCALIAYQRPGALALATYSGWGRLGYQVRTGETCTVRIVGPSPKGGFRTFGLFDITQTDADLEEDPCDGFQEALADLCGRFPEPEPGQEVQAAALVDVAVRESLAA